MRRRAYKWQAVLQDIRNAFPNDKLFTPASLANAFPWNAEYFLQTLTARGLLKAVAKDVYRVCDADSVAGPAATPLFRPGDYRSAVERLRERFGHRRFDRTALSAHLGVCARVESEVVRVLVRLPEMAAFKTNGRWSSFRFNRPPPASAPAGAACATRTSARPRAAPPDPRPSA